MKATIAWFARNSVAANLLMLAMLAAGLLALPNLRQQVFPEMQLAIITVTVPYRGASPEEVEGAVCIRVEERLQGIEGIRRLLCSADEGVGVVTAELSSWADSDQVHDDIQTEVDAIDTFPAETERPLIRQAVIRNQVLSLAVAGDLEERDLRAIGRQVRDEIADLPEVFRRHLDGVVGRIEEEADAETCRVMDLSSPYDLLGLYRGIDVGHKEQSGIAPLNDTIFLYRKPILLYRLETGETLADVVQHVLIHEIGHHFGLSDDDMERIERSGD